MAMAPSLPGPTTFFSFLALILLFNQMQSCSCFNLGRYNLSKTRDFRWFPAGATWYGSPDGAGSDGGACGYQSAVKEPPFSSMIAAGGPSLFKSGNGCGACYQVKCTANAACSRRPVTVVITDSCPGGICAAEPVHFDLSGTAFGAMAMPGWGNQLRSVGILPIKYRRVSCYYRGTKLAFHVDQGSNPYYFSVIIEFQNGDGDLRGVDLLQTPLTEMSSYQGWIPMQQIWGANWKLNSGSPLQAPFSLRLVSISGKFVVVRNVIPNGWQPGITYRSSVNFRP